MAKAKIWQRRRRRVTREEFPDEKARELLKTKTIAVIGYGVQGPGQSLNMRDNGFNVIVGQRKPSKTWDKAVADGWKPGETLFEIEEALQRGTIMPAAFRCCPNRDVANGEETPDCRKTCTSLMVLVLLIKNKRALSRPRMWT